MTRTALLKIIGAVAAIALCIGACCACDAVFACGEANQDAASSAVSGNARSHLEAVKGLIDGEPADTIKAASEIFDLSIETTLPEDFTQEALDARAFEEVRASGSTISFTYAGSCTDAATYCTEALSTKGWYALSENNNVTTSFAKADGAYRWLVLQYLALDDKTIVLVNIINLD